MEKTKSFWFFLGLYSITYLALLAFAGFMISDRTALMEPWQTGAVTAGVTVCALLLFFILRAAGVKYTVRKSRNQYRRKPSYLLIDILSVVLIYLVTLLLRIFWMNGNPLKITGNEELFYHACVTQNIYADARFSFHGMTWLYGQLLHGFCILLGNDAVAVFGLNLVIQVLTVFAGYLLLRILLNRKAAVIFAVLYNVLPPFLDALALSDPVQLYLLLVLVCMAFTVLLNQKAVFLKPRTGYVLYILCGILTGILLFCDLFSLFLLASGAALLSGSEMTGEGKRKFRFLTYLSGWVIGVVLAVAAGALIAMKGTGMDAFLKGAENFVVHGIQLYSRKFEFVFLAETNAGWNLWVVILTAVSGMPAVLQWKNRKEVLPCMAPVYFGVTFMILFRLFQMDETAAISCVCVLSAAMGFGMIFEMEHPLTELKNRAAVSVSDSKESDAKPEAEAAKPGKEEAAKTGKTVTLIENPLPLPKKRAHKEMDYQYEVSEDQMHYDVQVPDHDDFELR